jgi:hypothetical protein
MNDTPAQTGGCAFPALDRANHGGLCLAEPGMTLRDYFAAKAMHAMISKSGGQDATGGKKGVPLIAVYAYEFADAMLKARSA